MTAFLGTKSGRRFHVPGCVEVDVYKTPNARSVSIRDIERRRLLPCKVCNPILPLRLVR